MEDLGGAHLVDPRGGVYVFCFIVAVEILYLLKVGGGSVNSFACGILEMPESECS